MRWVLAWTAGALLSVAALVGILYLYGRGKPTDLGAGPDAVLATLMQDVPALALALLAVVVLAWCFRHLSLDWLAWRSARIVVGTFTAGSELPGVDLAQLTMRFRQELSRLHLQSPTPVPGVASDGDFLEVLGRGPLDPKNLLGSLITLARAAKPTHAWEVSAVVSERTQPPCCGVTVQVLRVPGQASSPQSVWGSTWDEAMRRAADHATATILPRTLLCRPPWASWRRFVMKGELFEAYEQAARLEEDRRYDEALAALYRALDADPMNMAIRLRIGQLQEKLALYLDALATYQAMREIDRRRRRSVRLEWWRYRPQTRAERRRALHTAAYRRIVLLGGRELVEQWRRTAREENEARWTERDRRREELRARLRRQLPQDLAHVAERCRLPGGTIKQLLESPPPGPSQKGEPDDAELALRCRLRELFALAAVRDLSKLKWQARRHPFTTATSPKALRLTTLCLKIRLAWIREAHGGKREWLYPTDEIDKKIALLALPFGLRRWHERYNAAVAYALPLLAAPSDGHADLALHHLARATSFADSAYIASRRDWLVSEDPDLDGLRACERFKDFEAVYFPGDVPTPPRPRRVHRLENARYVRALLVETADRWEDAWHARGRRLAMHPDIHEMLRWWSDECDAWKLVRYVAGDYRHWRARLDVLSSMRTWSDTYGFEPLRVSFGRYEADPLLAAKVRDNAGVADEAIQKAEDRLALLCECLPDEPAVQPAAVLLRDIEFWQSTLRNLDAASLEPRRWWLAALCDHHAALWQRLQEWLASDFDASDEKLAGAFSDQVLRTSNLWHQAHREWRSRRFTHARRPTRERANDRADSVLVER